VLGYLDTTGSNSDLGRLDLEAAREAIRSAIAGPLGLSVEAAAAGVFQLANAQMAGAVRLVSMAKGYDPRDFALLAFGGAGPVHAWAVAQELGIARVVVPPFAGVNSAVGLLQADFRVDLSRGHRTRLGEPGRAGAVSAILSELEDEARSGLLEQGHGADQIAIAHSADMRYAGQSYDVLVPFPAGTADLDALQAAFHAEHERAYGHAHPDDEVEITVLRTSATAPGVGFHFDGVRLGGDVAAGERRRSVRFGATGHDAVVLARTALGADGIAGPALLEESDTTIVVPPGARAETDAAGFVTVLLNGETSYD
jgi:N-methylhydantoinase A